MRGTKIVTIMLAAAGLLLAGCSSGDDTTTPQASTADSSAPEDSPSEDSGDGEASGDLVDWAGDLCGAIRPLEEEFDGLQEFQPTQDPDPAAVIEQLRATFSEVGPVFAAAHDAVEDAGPPPVDGGDEVYDNMLTVLSAAADAFAQIDAELAGLDPTDPAALEALAPIFSGIGQELEEAGTELDTAFSQPDMKAAFAEAPECAGLDMTSS